MTSPRNSKPKPVSRFGGLSAKVLWLSILFVMLGEVLIFLPSIANYRIQWLKTRVAQAEIAALAVEAARDQQLDDTLRNEILKGAGVVAVSLKRGDTRQLMIRNTEDAMVDETFDLRPGMYYNTVLTAIDAMFRGEDRVIGIIDKPPNMTGELIEVALHEQPMVKAMRQYGVNILLLSIVLSLIVAAFIYAALNRVLVKPMQRLSANMMHFGEKPEDATRVIVPSTRRDELGMAESELHDMQTELQSLLQQKNRLASVGLAVSKVSHDLRNMLTSAQIISDSLATVEDPRVQRFAPRLILSLDRAINFLNQTLKFGQARELPPVRTKLDLHMMSREVLDNFTPLSGSRIAFNNAVPKNFTLAADREQLLRILTNIVKNGVQAVESQTQESGGTPEIRIEAQRVDKTTRIRVRDTGPGIPETVRDSLFEAFQSAAKPGGTGLGLAIAAELVEAHGGTICVAETGPQGTIFEVLIPDQNTVVEQ
jgi:signal transduction histidine kinase